MYKLRKLFMAKGKKCPKCGGAMVEKGNKIVCMDEQCGYVEAKEKK